ncbi:MAG: hypothetical protein GY851_35180 [bacterium]|nr:hypothetical protein [bacterium]
MIAPARYCMGATRREGSALIMALGYLAAISIFVTVFLTFLHRTSEQFKAAERRESAYQLAEAGLNKAMAELRRNPDAYRGEEGTVLGDGAFAVTIVPTETASVFDVVSEGTLTDIAARYAHVRISCSVQLDRTDVCRVSNREVSAW